MHSGFLDIPYIASVLIQNDISSQEHVPVLSTLCNPGLRTRHWNAMSDIIGYDIAPDSSTTLRKMLKNNLSPYIDEFEGISGGASKVILWETFYYIVKVSVRYFLLRLFSNVLMYL